MSAGERIAAGQLGFALDGSDVVDVRWGGLDVAARIQVTLRDPGWGTIGSTLRTATVARLTNGVGVALEGVHEHVGFRWRATIDAFERGELTFAFDGVAERSFLYRRLGICIVHPWRSYVGASYEASTKHGSRRGTFPMPIHPQARVDDGFRPMIEAFSALTVRFDDGASLEMDLEGDLFELEDQRNWTDASFKTYTTPLALSEPRRMEAGQHVRQRAVLRLGGTPPARTEPVSPTVSVRARTGAAIPPIGMSVTSEPFAGAAHVRIPHVAANPIAASPTSLRIPIELALLVDPVEREIDPTVLRIADLPLARVLVLRTDEETSSGELVDDVRARFGAAADGLPFVGGTATYFSELNRNPPNVGALEGIAFAVSPEVHAVDERSVRESIEILPQVLAQAHALADAPVHVSPVTLSADHDGRFADAWTIGCLATLIGAGAASVTIDASSSAASVIAQLRGAPTLDTRVSDPLRIAALGSEDEKGRRAFVVNLTDQPMAFSLNEREEPPLGPYELRSCEPSTASS